MKKITITLILDDKKVIADFDGPKGSMFITFQQTLMIIKLLHSFLNRLIDQSGVESSSFKPDERQSKDS